MFLYRQNTSSIQRVTRWAPLVIVVGVWLWYTYNNSAQDIHPKVFQQPLQLLKEHAEFSSLVLGEHKLDIQIVGRLTLWGVVTSISDRTSIDKYNMISLCLLWGNNLSLYREGNYTCWHKNGRCMLKIPKNNRKDFRINNFSNNHILLPTKKLQDEAKLLNVGDQIKISGDLVNIKRHGLQHWLNTSVIRSDVGDGACEIILPERLEILVSKKKNSSMLLHAIFLFLSIAIIYFNKITCAFRGRKINKRL